MHRAGREIDRYNGRGTGFMGMLYQMGASIYNRLRNMVTAAFSFSRRDDGAAGDMSPRDEEDRSWMARVGQFLCSTLSGDSSTSSLTDAGSTDGRKPPENQTEGRGRGQSADRGLESCPSTTVTIGSSVPSGTNLYERESDIEYFYPDPAFVVEGPPSESETVIVHKSISQTLNE